MITAQHSILSRRSIKLLLKYFLFVNASGFIWWISNNCSFTEGGTDPQRFSQYALYSTIPHPEGYNHNIVFLLKAVFAIYPSYISYLFVVSCLGFVLLKYCHSLYLEYILFNPISFFFVGQSGKDWWTILATGIIVNALVFKNQNIKKYVILISSVLLLIFLRGQAFLYVIIALLIRKKNKLLKLLTLITLLVLFCLASDFRKDTPNLLSDTASQTGSGQIITSLRMQTLGYNISAISLRSLFYIVSPFTQPFIDLIRFKNQISEANYVDLFQFLCVSIFLIETIKTKRLFLFFKINLHFAIIIAIFVPLYHFRYLLIMWPLIYLLCKK